MSIVLVLVLAQLYATYVSAAALPITAASNQIWDMQRATTFNTILEGTLKDAPNVLDSKSTTRNTKLTPSQPMKIIKRTTACKFTTKHLLPSINELPMGGMQCAVM
jgi:hypothetical protein